LHGLDDTEAVLDWTRLEALMDDIYASPTGRPSYPLLTLLRSLIVQPDVWKLEFPLISHPGIPI
jgi:hypothetical protein